jgi:hypothetical protein
MIDSHSSDKPPESELDVFTNAIADKVYSSIAYDMLEVLRVVGGAGQHVTTALKIDANPGTEAAAAADYVSSAIKCDVDVVSSRIYHKLASIRDKGYTR